jgi:hypothetical protein
MHTPGPWKQSAYIVWSPDAQQVICAVSEPEPKSGNVTYEKLQIGSKNFDVAMDNARLIVAAPDVLEALEELVDAEDHVPWDEYSEQAHFHNVEAALIHARKIIENAKE